MVENPKDPFELTSEEAAVVISKAKVQKPALLKQLHPEEVVRAINEARVQKKIRLQRESVERGIQEHAQRAGREDRKREILI